MRFHSTPSYSVYISQLNRPVVYVTMTSTRETHVLAHCLLLFPLSVVPCVCLSFVIVVFLDHTHLLFFMVSPGFVSFMKFFACPSSFAINFVR